jgi:hypothetical protein
METLVLNKSSPALNDFLSKRKMKYDIWNETLYHIIWEQDALELRKAFLNNKKKDVYKQKHPSIESNEQKLSHYIRKKMNSLQSVRSLPPP